MLRFHTTVKRFGQKGEKSGWTYLEITEAQAGELSPGNRKSFRVKGQINGYPFEQTALIPMGDGSFILALNAPLRKKAGLRLGDRVAVELDLDSSPKVLSDDLMACLEDDLQALEFFNSLAPSHRHYFSDWIESAKTIPTKTKRIAMTVDACAKGWGFSEMIRAAKADRVGGR